MLLVLTQAGRQTGWGGGNRFIKLSRTLEITTGRCRQAPGGWASPVLLRVHTECLSSLVLLPWTCLSVPPPPAKIWRLCSWITGSASGQAYFGVESNCPTKSTTTEAQQALHLWFHQQYGLCASWNSPCAGAFHSSSPIQTLWCVITFKLAPAVLPAEALVEPLSFAQLPVLLKLAQT